MCLAQCLTNCSDRKSVSGLRRELVSWGVSLPEELKLGPILPFLFNRPSNLKAAKSNETKKQTNKQRFIHFLITEDSTKAPRETFPNTLLCPQTILHNSALGVV